MSDLVPTDQIEEIVGAKRHTFKHIGRAVSSEERLYILHSELCLLYNEDLRECRFSRALDLGIDPEGWREYMDRPVVLSTHEFFGLCPNPNRKVDQ
jgi:hypothetical protein